LNGLPSLMLTEVHSKVLRYMDPPSRTFSRAGYARRPVPDWRGCPSGPIRTDSTYRIFLTQGHRVEASARVPSRSEIRKRLTGGLRVLSRPSQKNQV